MFLIWASSSVFCGRFVLNSGRLHVDVGVHFFFLGVFVLFFVFFLSDGARDLGFRVVGVGRGRPSPNAK
jgi:hypothetical protein